MLSTRSRSITPFTWTTPFSSNSRLISSSDVEAGMGLSHPRLREGMCPMLEPRSSSDNLYSIHVDVNKRWHSSLDSVLTRVTVVLLRLLDFTLDC